MTSTTRTRTVGRTLGVIALLVIVAAGQVRAQRISRTKGDVLSPPRVRVVTTPLTVTVSWGAVEGAESYTVEQASTPTGPWSPMPLDPRAGTQVTAPTIANANSLGGTLYYYRVTAQAPLGPRGELPLTGPGVTVVPQVTPTLNAPLGVVTFQDGADLRAIWAPVPHATGYLVTAAPGPLLLPTQTIEVGAQYAEARLVNVASATLPQTTWVGVSARYGTAGALSKATVTKAVTAAVQYCWPPSSVPGPVPTVSITSRSLASFDVTTANARNGIATIRVERAPMGSPAWQSVGCGNGTVVDHSLALGTQYQYRVTEISGNGAVGQTTVLATTPPAPDNPTPTATVSGCSATGCTVMLSWSHVATAEEYRIESSYGLYRAFLGLGRDLGATTGGWLMNVPLGTVPSGVHSFYLTALFPSMRPNPKQPGQVTVVVP